MSDSLLPVLEFVAGERQKCGTPVPVHLSDDDGREWRGLSFNGVIQPVKLSKPERHDYDHHVRTLDDLGTLSRMWAASGADLSVWIAENQVILAAGAALWDRATCDLPYHQSFSTLQNLESTPALRDQTQFVRLLRHTLAGRLDTCPELLPAVRQVKFTKSSQVEGDVQHGIEALGTQHRLELCGADRIPESVVISCDVYEPMALSLEAQVACSVDIDLNRQAFLLQPIPGEIDHVKWVGLCTIRARLEAIFAENEANIPPAIYFGKP